MISLIQTLKSKKFSKIFNFLTNRNNKIMPRKKTNDEIPDIQNTIDGFPKKYIPKVGSRNIVVPMEIVRKDGTINPTKAIISMYTDLTPEVKGTNMSRYRILVEEVLANKTHRIDEVMDVDGCCIDEDGCGGKQTPATKVVTIVIQINESRTFMSIPGLECLSIFPTE
jgi:hypothetical protein